MTRSIATLLFTAALAACGSKTAAPNTTPVEPMPVAGDSSGAMAGSDAPRQMPEPAEPEQPAKPPPPDPAKAKADLLAAETAAWESAKPAFQKSCATCHTKGGKKAAKKKLDHFTMDSYPPGGHHTATIGLTIRDVLGISGKQPTMPFDKPGSVTGDDLAAIKAWADAWETAEKGGAHPPAEDHHH